MPSSEVSLGLRKSTPLPSLAKIGRLIRKFSRKTYLIQLVYSKVPLQNMAMLAPGCGWTCQRDLSCLSGTLLRID